MGRGGYLRVTRPTKAKWLEWHILRWHMECDRHHAHWFLNVITSMVCAHQWIAQDRIVVINITALKLRKKISKTLVGPSHEKNSVIYWCESMLG